MIPLIFAFSIMIFPAFVGQTSWRRRATRAWPTFGDFLTRQRSTRATPGYWIFVFVTVVVFTFFYTLVVFQQQNLAENLQKQGGFIPGIRPGRPTEEYIMRVLVRITWAGAFFLGIVAVAPFIFRTSSVIDDGSGGGRQRRVRYHEHRPAHRRRRRAGHDEAARGAAA